LAAGSVSAARITLLTDFGTRDGFVGAVKGVLAALAPDVLVDDIAHDLPAGDIRSAALVLPRYWRRYPEGTVHLVVVDPGVGTGRRAVACSAAGRFLVAPDNGVLTPVLTTSGSCCFKIEGAAYPAPVSSTFHARDIFAPVAAALAFGTPLTLVGPAVDDPVLMPEPEAVRSGAAAIGSVVGVDRFGNATTNLPGGWAEHSSLVDVAGLRLVVYGTYGDVAIGDALALVDSEGWIEVAVRDGSAAECLGLGAGSPVMLSPS
jgi:S-adenosylmethionine hydrolase